MVEFDKNNLIIMVGIVLVVSVCIALAMSVVIGVYALFKSQSHKKNYFLLMQTMIITYLLGYLLELTSGNAEEAYTAVKILYLGANLVPVFAFFFLTDYCNIKIHPVYIKAPMIILAFIIILAMWTSKYQHLLYLSYSFDTEINHSLSFTPGPLYSVFHAYPAVCMIITMIILIYHLKKWANKYRNQLLILLICIVIPFIAEGIYWLSIITGINPRAIYLTPYSLAIMSMVLYYGLIRFNIFELISVATTTAMDHIREGFILVDEHNNYLSSNSAAEKMLPGIMKLKKGESVFSAADWPKELNDVESSNADFSIAGGNTRYFSASISPIYTNNNALMARIFLLKETTDNVNLMKELENAAYVDSLTGLYNRKHFNELAIVDIERAQRLNQPIYTAMLDLDFFKRVNDTHGHLAGDMVLKATAGIIRQTIRSYDLLCRYGGEEFVLLLTALEGTEAYKMVERIRENMEHSTIVYEEEEIRITCSIGLAPFLESDTLESAIKKADEALYDAKNTGRNKVQIYRSHNQSVPIHHYNT